MKSKLPTLSAGSPLISSPARRALLRASASWCVLGVSGCGGGNSAGATASSVQSIASSAPSPQVAAVPIAPLPLATPPLSPGNTAPNWYAAIAPGTWGVLPNSVLNGSAAQLYGALSGWNTTNSNVLSPWSGGFLNTNGIYTSGAYDGSSVFIPGTFFCLWGGGHVDYGGNEMYCYGPLESSSPQWHCPRAATNPPPFDVEYDGSGNPVSRHTYCSLVYLPTTNRMMAVGTPYRWTDAGGGPDCATFQFNMQNPATKQPWAQLAHPTMPCMVTAYDAKLGGVWGLSMITYSVFFYDVTTNSWMEGNDNFNVGYYYMGADVDVNRGIFATFGGLYGGGHGLWFYTTNNGVSNQYWVPNTTGTGPNMSETGACGSIAYDSFNDCFVVWPGGSNGGTLYTLKAPAANPYQGGNPWTWTKISPSAGATPDLENPHGTFGRFRSVTSPIISGYILLNSVTSSIYFYRP